MHDVITFTKWKIFMYKGTLYAEYGKPFKQYMHTARSSPHSMIIHFTVLMHTLSTLDNLKHTQRKSWRICANARFRSGSNHDLWGFAVIWLKFISTGTCISVSVSIWDLLELLDRFLFIHSQNQQMFNCLDPEIAQWIILVLRFIEDCQRMKRLKYAS